MPVLRKLQDILSSGTPISRSIWSAKEKLQVEELMLLSSKPVIYVCNVDEDGAKGGNDLTDQVQEELKRIGSNGAFFQSKLKFIASSAEQILPSSFVLVSRRRLRRSMEMVKRSIW